MFMQKIKLMLVDTSATLVGIGLGFILGFVIPTIIKASVLMH
jgi:hypothetical protein